MRHHSLSYLAVGILIAFLVPPPPLASGDILRLSCNKSWNYTANSTYQSNLKQLSAALPKNASSSPALFATASVGAIPDTVYALTHCRGDINASDCAACIAIAFQDAQQVCAYNMDVTIYYETCLLRFSNQNFLATLLNTNQNPNHLSNPENVTSPTVLFDAAVGLLINAVIDYAVLNSSKRFGTGEEDFDKTNPKIYGLAQCTPDMAPADCRSCLEDIMKAMPKYFSGSQGGRIWGLRCAYRY